MTEVYGGDFAYARPDPRALRESGLSDGDYDGDVLLRPPAFAQAPAQVADVAG